MEELLKQLLQEVKEIKNTMATKEDVERIVTDQQKDVMAVLQLMDKKLNDAATKKDLDRIAGDINFLVRKAVEHDDDIRSFRQAR